MTTGDPEAKVRDAKWDAFRAIAIIAVIWIHTPSGLAYKSGPAAWNFDYWLVLRQFINFPVALFLFLSGFFVKPEKLSPPQSWIKSRSARLVGPFLIWSIFYALVSIFLGDAVITSPILFAGKILLGLTAGHLYFIVVLVQLTLLTPLMVRMLRSSWRWVGLTVTPVYIIALYVYTFMLGDLPTGYSYPFAAWVVFYYLGLWTRVRGVPKILPGVAAAFYAVAVVASVGEAYALLCSPCSGMPDGLAASQLKLSSIVASLGFVAVVLALQSGLRGAPPHWLAAIGRRSYGICQGGWDQWELVRRLVGSARRAC